MEISVSKYAFPDDLIRNFTSKYAEKHQISVIFQQFSHFLHNFLLISDKNTTFAKLFKKNNRKL